jgi:hypothetical protein
LLTSLFDPIEEFRVRRPTVSEIKSPPGLAALGAFFVPEPLGACLVIAAGIWWLCRKPFSIKSKLGIEAAFDAEDDPADAE